MENSPFTSEFRNRKDRRLLGDVHIFNRSVWNYIMYCLLGIGILVISVLSMIEFTETTDVSAIIEPDLGIAKALVPRAGTVVKVDKKEGDHISKGGEILLIDTSAALKGGSSDTGQTRYYLESEMQELQQQQDIGENEAASTHEKLLSDWRQSSNAIEVGKSELELQDSLIAQARSALDRTEPLKARGFISATALDALKSGLLSQEQKKKELLISQAERIKDLSNINDALKANDRKGKIALSAINIQRSELKQRDIASVRSGSYALIAPMNGRVANIHVHAGASVQPGDAGFDLMPDGSHLSIILKIPEKDILTIKIGDTLSVKMDALPYQRYGMLRATVTRISGTLSSQTSDKQLSPYFEAYARIDGTSYYDKLVRQLRVDMIGIATVTTSRKTILRRFLEGMDPGGADI